MRRPATLVLFAMLLSGCLAAEPGSPGGGMATLCPAPCERAVDTGPDRAFEPAAALHPDDPERAIVVSSVFQDRDEDGYNDRFKVHLTGDGGRTWETFRFEDQLAPTNPVRHYTNWGDPWLVWLDDGSLLLFGMGAIGTLPDAPMVAFTSFDVFVARSTDGGRSWPDGQVLARGKGTMSLAAQMEYFDQPHVAVGRDGHLLAGWLSAEALPDGTVRQDILAVQSSDGGRTWGEPVVVDRGIFHNPRPAVAPDGSLFMAYRDYTHAGPARPVLLSRSDDGGATWARVELGNLTSISRPSLAANADGVHVFVAEAVEDAFAGVTLATLSEGKLVRLVLAEMEGEGEPLVTLVGDPKGGLWATWHVVQPDSTNQLFAWHRAADGSARTQRIDTTPIGPNDPQGFIGWPSLGDYQGLQATKDGAIVAWVSGERGGQDVRAAWLR